MKTELDEKFEYYFELLIQKGVKINKEKSYNIFKYDWEIKQKHTYQHCRYVCFCSECGKEIYKSYQQLINRSKPLFCRKCSYKGNKKKYTLEKAIDKLNKKNIDLKININKTKKLWLEYDKQNIKPTYRKVICECIQCGKEYKNIWYNSLYRPRFTCQECANKYNGKLVGERSTKYTFEKIKNEIEKYNKCILLTTKDEYVNNKDKGISYKFTIKCGLCGKVFKRTFNNFITGRGQKCKECCQKEKIAKLSLKFEDCIKAIQNKGNEVNTEKSYKEWIKNKDLGVKPNKRSFYIKCRECNNWFWVKYSDFIKKRTPKRNCKICSGSISYSERLAKYFLEKNNIKFESEKTFKDAIYIKNVFFDYYIEDKYLLELDGKQHFYPATFGGISKTRAEKLLIESQERDKFKNEYCINNKIKLIRIPYWDFKKINEILSDILLNNNNNSKYIIQNNMFDKYVNYYFSHKNEFKSKRQNITLRKKIICIENNMVFESICECVRRSKEIFGIDLNTTGISRSCIRKNKYKNYTFRYLSDIEELKKIGKTTKLIPCNKGMEIVL